jgi:hypothetical protein
VAVDRRQWSGDFEAAQRAGVALQSLASFHAAYGAAVASATDEVVGYDWRGNAADAAGSYLHTLARSVRDNEAALADIGKQFETMATGVYMSAQGFKGLFEIALDLALVAAIKAAASAVNIWNPAGWGLAGVVAALIAKIAHVWYQAVQVHDKAWQSTQAFAGVVAGYLGGLDGLDELALPATSYDHPGV